MKRGRPPIDPNRTEKRCPICKLTKEREEFPISRASRDGMHSVCQLCASVETSAWILSKLSLEELEERLAYYKQMTKRTKRVRDGMIPRDVARVEAKERS